MKKSLFVLIASGVLAGSVFAQTAVPAVNAAAAKVVAAPAAVASAAKAAVMPATPAAPVAAPATTAPATTPATTPATAAPAAAPATKPAAASTLPAAGGGAGKVWVNGKVYHCEGSKFYGKTKAGSYMAEAEAKAKGAHGAKGQVCSK